MITREEIEARAILSDKQARDISALRAKVAVLEKERQRFLEQLQVIESLDRGQIRVPKWLTPAKPARGHHATLCLLVTDTHFDEIVNPSEIDGINCYNREIAGLRLRRCFERAIMLGRDYLSGVTYDGAALFFGGDIFSGNIHEELVRTNADTLFGSLLYWIGPTKAGILMMLEEFKKLHIAVTPGNHGRMTRKPIAKQRATDNLDWLFYRTLARELASEPNITWTIPDAADTHVKIYETRYLLTHGDQFRGGSGISGAMSPLLLGAHRKTRRQAAAGKPYEYMIMGHWHQEVWLPAQGVLAGNCMKGFDEYAYVSNFTPTPPAQQLWLTTPERGVTVSAPVFVMDRPREGW